MVNYQAPNALALPGERTSGQDIRSQNGKVDLDVGLLGQSSHDRSYVGFGSIGCMLHCQHCEELVGSSRARQDVGGRHWCKFIALHEFLYAVVLMESLTRWVCRM
jgi:hypothetical protein